jgi:drug/metabolite transporter (DMT)-like permease
MFRVFIPLCGSDDQFKSCGAQRAQAGAVGVAAGFAGRRRMRFPVHLVYPLVSSAMFAVAALLMKRALAEGIGLWRISAVSIWVMAAMSLPLLWLARGQWPALPWHQPCLVAAVFVAAQLLTLMALGRGEVSVATPLLGTKVIFVALLTVGVLREHVTLRLWTAAVLAAAAVFVVSNPLGRARRRTAPTVALALASALLFALADILVQKWAPAWGFARFVPVTFLAAAALALGMIPLFSRTVSAIPRAAWRWLGAGSALMSLQGLAIVYTLTVYGEATAVNVVYNTRGIWSVMLVWTLGHWFGNPERDAGRAVMGARLLGASLILVAVALAAI